MKSDHRGGYEYVTNIMKYGANILYISIIMKMNRGRQVISLTLNCKLANNYCLCESKRANIAVVESVIYIFMELANGFRVTIVIKASHIHFYVMNIHCNSEIEKLGV